jgi:hypothetical protein
MKNVMRYAFLLLLAAGLGSCSLLDIDFETTLSGVLDVEVEEPMAKGMAEWYPFSSFATIDPTDDKEVEKYVDKIVSVGVDGVIATVESVSTGGIIFKSGTTFSIYDDEDTVSWPIPKDWLIESDDFLMLEDLHGNYDAVEDILLKMEEFTIGMVGNSSEAGVLITIRLDVKTTITGNPLE